MMRKICIYSTILLFSVVNSCDLTSPFPTYNESWYSSTIEADKIELRWMIDRAKKEIVFELIVKTVGWIALGISPAGGMIGADIALGWIDQTGKVHLEDRYASGKSQPMPDNTTSDWFPLQGRQENGSTAIQFKRALDTCDPMDYPIKSGTNILIFAYGLEDPIMCNGKALINYHENRRFTRMIPLQSYSNPPSESQFVGLDYFEMRINNYSIPVDDTTYYCKVFKSPINFKKRRHAIAYQILIDPGNRDLLHHLVLYECQGDAFFNGSTLPEGLCDDILIANVGEWCSNIALGWAVGGNNIVEYPAVAGYPIGGNLSVKYYMLQSHYDNPTLMKNRIDNSGVRFYLGKKRRQYDIGTFTFGTFTHFTSILIPPRMESFAIDSYCSAETTNTFPSEGVTVFNAFPHAHLQGRSIWSKIIRNHTAVQYLFNAEAYSFDHQFTNTLPEPIKLYRGDEIATRCVYSTLNKAGLTLGGESTRDEMCLNIFAYYPRMESPHLCLTTIAPQAWLRFFNITSWNISMIMDSLRKHQWTPESSAQFQTFVNEAPHKVYITGDYTTNYSSIGRLPIYQDLKADGCH